MKPSFCGWYFKVQSSECSIALIPAVHGSTEKSAASLQILWGRLIALLKIRGREYRFASYLGARLVSARGGRVEIRQGSLVLTAERLGQAGQPLNAPFCGAMTRTIHKNLCCPVCYQLRKDGWILWELETDRAFFELEYPC